MGHEAPRIKDVTENVAAPVGAAKYRARGVTHTRESSDSWRRRSRLWVENVAGDVAAPVSAAKAPHADILKMSSLLSTGIAWTVNGVRLREVVGAADRRRKSPMRSTVPEQSPLLPTTPVAVSSAVMTVRK
jgi:hypothetical protein